MDAIDAILSRNSYRGHYLDTPVPKEDVRRIMECGLAAPSGCNRQTTSLIGITDPELLEKLCNLCDPPIGGGCTAAICVLTQEKAAIDGKFYNIQDYSAAIQNMLIAITALGYHSCWYEGRVNSQDGLGRSMAQLLEVPEGYELVCFLPIGVAKDAVKKPHKKAFENRAWFNGFDKAE